MKLVKHGIIGELIVPTLRPLIKHTHLNEQAVSVMGDKHEKWGGECVSVVGRGTKPKYVVDDDELKSYL